MKICVVGLGYVGAVTSICLARDGHDVLGIDLDTLKVKLIREGRSPIVESGVQELTQEVVSSGNLKAAVDIPSDIASYDVVFVCVGTPSAENGSQDLTALRRVSEEIADNLVKSSGYPVLVYRSTVEPGTMRDVVWPLLEKRSGLAVGQDFGLCFQPEFLREGSSIDDFDNPPVTVVGVDSPGSLRPLREIFSRFDAEFVETSIDVAEMLKLACNAFHALKIGFANEIGRIGQAAEVDPREVMRILCKDERLNISPTYLRPGYAFGGSCLPKDLRALVYAARKLDVSVPLLEHLNVSNLLQIEHACKLVMSTGSRNVGLLGLSFKQGTDDLRESPLVELAERLIGKGYELRIYDPTVRYAQLIGSNLEYINSTIPHIGRLITENLNELLEYADVIIVGHNQPDTVDAAERHLSAGGNVVDVAGLPRRLAKYDGYKGVCW